MIAKKPGVLIYTNGADPDILHEICAGIEEEGVLYEIAEMTAELDELSFRAASDSILGSGVGIKGKQAAMQMSLLPQGQNVFELNHPTFMQCRTLGANSARAVKKLSFRTVY